MLDLWNLQYYVLSLYPPQEKIHAIVAKYGTPNLLCKTNGRYYPVLAEKGGIFYAVTDTSSYVEWNNHLERKETTEQNYYELIEKNHEAYQIYWQKIASYHSKPRCSICKKEFATINGFHKHKCNG